MRCTWLRLNLRYFVECSCKHIGLLPQTMISDAWSVAELFLSVLLRIDDSWQ